MATTKPSKIPKSWHSDLSGTVFIIITFIRIVFYIIKLVNYEPSHIFNNQVLSKEISVFNKFIQPL